MSASTRKLLAAFGRQRLSTSAGGSSIHRRAIQYTASSQVSPQEAPAAAAAVFAQRRQFSFIRAYAHADATQLLDDARTVAIQWHDGLASSYDITWLRVNCPSMLHATGQKLVTPRDVNPDLKPTEITNSKGSNKVVIKWSDGLVSEYRASWLRAHDNSPSSRHQRSHGSWPVALYSWDSIKKVNGKDYVRDDVTLYRALKTVNQKGICRLDNVGTKEGTVLDLALRIGPISHSMLYGDSHDVTNQVNPRNLAYSSEALRLHMDLVYYESPPGLQLIHCVEFDDTIKGGESTFMDGFEAAKHFRDHNPAMFEVLARVPATFHKVRSAGKGVDGDDRNKAAQDPAHMVYRRPHFQVDPDGDILGVYWAPMFEGVLLCPHHDMGPYYEAYRAFQELIEDSQFAQDHTVVKRLQPGECLVFNNRRMLHGRTAFSGEGRRLLQGTYVNIDDYMSRLRTLHIAQPRSDDPLKNTLTRPGNGSLAHVDC